MNHSWVYKPISPGKISVLETCRDCPEVSWRYASGTRVYPGRTAKGCSGPQAIANRLKELAREIDRLMEFREHKK